MIARRRRSRLDVCFYSPWIGPLLSPGNHLPPGGAETQICLLARALSEAGVRVGIVSLDVPGGLPKSVDDVEVIVQRRPRTTLPILRPLALAASMIRTLASLDADVVVQRAAGTITGPLACITRLRRRRFVYSSANVIDFSYGDLEDNRPYVWLYELGVRLANEIVVQTDEQAVLCRERFRRDPLVIKSLAVPTAPAASEPESFLWVGRLAHYKHPEAFVALARALPDARFRMVGVPYGEEGERMAADLRADAEQLSNLELLEPRPRENLMHLIDRAVAMVNTAHYEGMPNIFLEAWSRGVPALALSHDPGGVVRRYGLGGFAAGDIHAFVSLARELWATRSDRSDLSQRCRAYIADEHAPRVIAQRWIGALASVSAVRASA